MVGALGLDGETIQLPRQADREIADVDHLLHLAEALGDDLADLQRDNTAEVGLEGAQFLAEQPDELAALRPRHGAPRAERLLSLTDDSAGFLRRGLLQL